MLPVKIEDLYRQIVETAYEGIWIVDAEMRTLYVNERLAEMLGRRAEEMSGTPLLDYLPPEDHAVTFDRVERRKKGVSEEFEAAYLRRDGTIVQAHVSTNPLYDEAGNFIGALGMFTDITEKKSAEEALRESENLLRLMTGAVPALIAYVDAGERYRFANEYYAEWFGVKPDSIVGQSVREFIGPAAYELIKPEIDRVLAGERLSFERLMPYRDRQRHVQVHYIPDFDGRQVKGFYGLVVDVSERKNAEDEARRSEERYRAFVSRSSEGIWRFELEEPIPVDLPVAEQIEQCYRSAYLAECNDAMARMYGFGSAAEIVGARIGDLLPRERPENVEYLKNFLAAGYRLENAETIETDRDGRVKVFLNNLIGVVENEALVRAWGTQRDVTAGKLAEQALRESEERYRIVAETASDAIISIDEESRIVFVNSAVEKIFGYTPEELIGQSLTRLLPEEMRDRHFSGLLRYLRTGERKQGWKRMEVPGRHADGHVFPLEISFDEYRRGGRRFFIGVARDISDRRRIEQATAHLAAIVRFSGEAIISKDLQGVITSWNESAEIMFGYAADEAIGRPITMIVPPDLIDEENMILARVASGGVVENYETRRRRRDGALIDISLTISPIEDEAGKIIGVSKIARDISERKAARATFERYRLLLMQARDIILFLRQDGRIFEVNQAAVEAYGYDYETLLTMRIHDLRAPETHSLIEEQYDRASRGGTRFETIHRRKDNTRFPVEVSSTGSEIGGERFLVSIVRDISERKRTEAILDENRVMLSLALRASRMGVWERDIAAGVVNWSEELEEIFGLEKGSFGGAETDFYELLHEDDRLEMWAEIERAIAERRDYTIEFRFYHRDGSVRWMEGRGRAVYSEKGEPIRLYGIGIDITERKRAEEALRESEERYRSLFNSVDQGFCIVEVIFDAANRPRDYRFIETNPMFEEQTGLTNAVGKTARELIPNLEPRWFEIYGRVALTGEPMRFVDGSEAMQRWFDVYAARLGGPESRKVAILFSDVTERRRIEEEVRTVNERFRIAELATDGFVYDWDLASDRVERSEGFTRVLGYDRTEIASESAAWRALMHPEDAAANRPLVESALNDSERTSLSVEYRLRHRNGDWIWVLDESVVLRDERGRARRRVGSTVNITDRKRRELSAEFFADLAKDFGLLSSADEIMRAAGEKLGAFLNVSACLFAEIDEERDEVSIDHVWNRAGRDDLVGVYRLSDLINDELQRAAHRGETIVVRDTQTDARTDTDAYDRFDIRSFVTVPFDRAGRWKYLLTIDHREARDWRADEIEFIEEFTNRIFPRLDRARAEAALQKSEAAFRTISDAAPAFVWVASPTGEIVYMNERWFEATGQTTDDAQGFGWSKLMHPDDADRILALWERSRATGESYEGECRYRHRGGEYVWYRFRALPHFHADGGIAAWYGISFDIHEAKMAEEKIRESEARFRRMADHAPVMIWVTDASGYCNFLSQSWYEFTGQTPETGLGLGWTEAVHPDDRKKAEETFLSANDRRAAFQVEYRFRRRDGEYRWAIDSAQPRFGDDGEYLGYIGSVVDIHERRAAEEKIRENESTLRAYYNSSPLMMGIVELPADDGDIYHVYDNPATCAFFGIDRDASAGLHASRLGLPPEIIGLWVENYRASERLNRPVNFEYEQAVGDERRWLSVTVSCIGGDGRSGARFAYVAEDTTDRKRAEAQVRYQLALTQTITDNTQSCLLMMDSEGRGTFANSATERVTGFKPEELIGQVLHEKIHHTHPDGTPFPIEDCPLDNALPLEEAVVGYEDVFVHKNGRFYPVRCNGRPIFQDGKPVGTVIEVQDITEEKRTQESLLKAERRAADEYQALLQRIVPLGQTLGTARDLTSIYRAVQEFVCSSMKCAAFYVSSYDARGHLSRAEYGWKEGAEIDVSVLPPLPLAASGAAAEAVTGKKTVITADSQGGQSARAAANGGRPRSALVVPLMVKSEVVGTLEVQAHETEAFQPEQAVALEMVANLTAVAIENVRLLEIEAAARREAEAANRAKDEFLSVLSHELRTPLNSMLGWVRMLKSGMLDEEKSIKAVEVIERNTLLQNTLIEDLLDVSRIISGKMRIEKTPLDLVKVFSEAVDILRPVASQKNIAFEFRTREDELFIDGDATRLQQIISNLVQNAIKFTPDGGAVSVRLSRRGRAARLAVTDNGIGIKPEIMPHIFERFRQADSSTKRVYSGLGLGLTIVRTLVELHGGEIRAESAGEGQGAVFTIEIPLAEEFLERTLDEAGESFADADAGRGALAGARILLVDDDAESLIPLQLFLEREKAEIVLAASAAEAVERLSSQKFDILITDIGMPLTDGYDLIARVRQLQTEQNAFITAIALTAYASTDDRRRALAAGFQGHFAKPVDFEELLSVIKQFYDRAR